jgi:hypothetical protein
MILGAVVPRFEFFDFALELLDVFKCTLRQGSPLRRGEFLLVAQGLIAPPNVVSQADGFEQTQQDGDLGVHRVPGFCAQALTPVSPNMA